MKRKSKKQDAGFAGIESALETKIKKIERISDPIEQLFQFRALRDSGEAKYDQKKVIPWNAHQKAELKYAKSVGWGFFTGLLGGIALGITLAATAVATGGVAFVAAWLGCWAAGTAVGTVIGRKQRKSINGSPEEKHATQMYHLAARIDWGVESKTVAFKYLTGNFQDKGNIATLARSSHFAELKKAFPEITAEFNRQAKIAAQQENFLARQEEFLAQGHPSAG